MNQYLFIQVAWKRTGAGGMTTTNIACAPGSSATPTGTSLLSSDFTHSVTGAFIDAASGATSVCDEYPESHQSVGSQVKRVGDSRGQSFLGNGGLLVGCKFALQKWTSTSVLTFVAKVYATTGTHGTNAVQAGTAFATSAEVTTSGISLSPDPYTYQPFVFSGSDQILRIAQLRGGD